MRLTVHCWCYKRLSREGDETWRAGGWKLSCVATPVLWARCLYIYVCVCMCVSGASVSLMNRVNLSFFFIPPPHLGFSVPVKRDDLHSEKKKTGPLGQYLLFTSASFSRLQALQDTRTLRPLRTHHLAITTYYFTYPLPFAPRPPAPLFFFF